ncbi:MAG: YjgP/YjgQ family permease [Cyanobacteria bacterium SIG28]|nr:YjgP/YjgQ family permease [Cyanobacteria bacterium SIG28]
MKKLIRRIIREYKSAKLLDKYILKQVVVMFIMGVLVFTSIIFASDTFITLIKQISKYGIPFKYAFIIIILHLPSVFVMTIPMGVLLATVMTLNGLSLSSEITVMRACGIGLNRIAKPIFAFAIVMSLVSFVVNETIVPVMMKMSTEMALIAFGQKHIPEGKQNFTFKEVQQGGKLKRLFYVGDCIDSTLHNITVLDASKEGTIQILQAREGKTSPVGWKFQKAVVYTISDSGKTLDTTLFNDSTVNFGMDLSKEMERNQASERNFLQLLKFIKKENKPELRIDLYDKMALPLTTIVLVLIGVPLAITPPRVRYNRGFLFSILIIFAYYLIRALSISFGEAGTLLPIFAAFMPNIILTVIGIGLYYRKVYTIC